MMFWTVRLLIKINYYRICEKLLYFHMLLVKTAQAFFKLNELAYSPYTRGQISIFIYN